MRQTVQDVVERDLLEARTGQRLASAQRGVEGRQPALLVDVSLEGFEDLFIAAQGVPELELESWADLERVDVKAGKGIVKFVAANNWEAQIDTDTGEVLQVAFRRSDIIEKLHDGSFFASWVKRFIFLPVGIVLLVMWGTGIYLFILPHWKRYQKKQRRKPSS